MYIRYNPNPMHNKVGDCTVRAITLATGQTWDDVYLGLCEEGFALCDMPSSNAVWGNYLKKKGFERFVIPNECPDCYTIIRFCEEHPHGTYILALSSHVVCVIDGDYYDVFDSGNEFPIYYWKRKED